MNRCRPGQVRSPLLVLVLLLLIWAAAGAHEGFSGVVVGVIDGDTISVMRHGTPVRVRLADIDCPERGQNFSQRAKEFTSDQVFGKVVDVRVQDVDRYGRLVARVQIGGSDLSLGLVQAGLAWHYKQYSTDPVLAAAERAARAKRKGLWSQPNAVPPWEYRHPASPANAAGKARRSP